MVDKKEAKRFKEVVKKGLWRDRYYVVTEPHFQKFKLVEDETCKGQLINVALHDNAVLVRREAVRTCNVLGITIKGKPIRLRSMLPLHKVTGMKDKRLKDIIFFSCVKAGIAMYPRNRELTDDEVMSVSIKFSEVYPELFDKIDGRTTENTRENISEIKNKSIYKLIRNGFKQVSPDRVEQYYKHHPEYRNNENRQENVNECLAV